MVWHKGNDKVETTPPHDIQGLDIASYLPRGKGAHVLIDLMRKSQEVLKEHILNRERERNGKKKVTSIWLWGQGKAPKFPNFREKYVVEGSVISAVDLIKGIAIYTGLNVIEVPGATGYLDTNYMGKAQYALKSLEKSDFVYVHVEAPDEASHNGDLNNKIKAIENFDSMVVGTVVETIEKCGDYKILTLCDHPTPISIRTHTRDPVPFIIYPFRKKDVFHSNGYSEKAAAKRGCIINDGHTLMSHFLGNHEVS
ncbi:MAG: hypothetical protein SVW57_10090 [Thermodesulfobacteriota bacterium]|nr:hypothetical protein [Thermodesulfobacteriota bacterium]